MQDPIGLLGGLNNYQYVPNPIHWVDPLGLSCKEGRIQSRNIPDNYNVLKGVFEPPYNADQAIHNKLTTGNEVVFAGHGSINPANNVTIPQGTYLIVYAPDGAMISDRLGGAIERGEAIQSIPKKVYSPGDVVPEYILPPNCGNFVIEPSSCQALDAVSIGELLKPNMGNCHWAACSSIQGHDLENVMYDTQGIYYIDHW